MSELKRLSVELIGRKNQVETTFNCTKDNGSIVALMSELCIEIIRLYESNAEIIILYPNQTYCKPKEGTQDHNG